MNEKQIVEVINKLLEQYYDLILSNNYSAAIDVHDEISRWERELKEKTKIYE